MLNVYRATDLMFAEEYELQVARSFARKSLEKTMSKGNRGPNDLPFASFKKLVIPHLINLSNNITRQNCITISNNMC